MDHSELTSLAASTRDMKLLAQCTMISSLTLLAELQAQHAEARSPAELARAFKTTIRELLHPEPAPNKI